MKSLYSIFLIVLSINTFSQPIHVGQPFYYEMARTLQVAGKLNSNNSFTVNSSASLPDMRVVDTMLGGGRSFDPSRSSGLKMTTSKLQLKLLPATLQTKFNSNRPYGWNDAGMIMAKGLQTQLSGGVFMKAGFLTVQLRPEYVWAANPSYDTTLEYGANQGKGLSKLYGGQSSIRVNAAGLSIGLSTESIWWGPGKYNSLLMSNNAPGFLHATFNTTKPIKTIVGSFEWQLIFARLNEDTARSFESAFLKRSRPRNDWRYLNGLIVSWQPSFLKNVVLGASATQQLYGNDQKSINGFFKKFFPVLSPSSPRQNAQTTSVATDGQFSVFARMRFPKHKAEIYAEYGKNDYSYNIRDFITNTQHAAAYIIGGSKFFQSPANNVGNLKGILISAEITQMAQMPDYLVRNAGNWYEHNSITQGYTHQNQIMGAGSGKGNNVQMLVVEKIHGFDKIGFKLIRIQQNPVAFDGSLPVNTLFQRKIKWTDIAIGTSVQKQVNENLLASAELQLIHANNFGWQENNATWNGLLSFNLTYRW